MHSIGERTDRSMEQNKEHRNSQLSSDKRAKITHWRRQSLQQIAQELDIHVQKKIKTQIYRSHTLYKKSLKINHRPKSKTPKYKTPRRHRRKSRWPWACQWPFRYYAKGTIYERDDKLIFIKIFCCAEVTVKENKKLSNMLEENICKRNVIKDYYPKCTGDP